MEINCSWRTATNYIWSNNMIQKIKDFVKKNPFIAGAITSACIVSTAWAADTKLSALTNLGAAPEGSDELYLNDGGAASKALTIDYLFDYAEGANLTITGNWVNTTNPWADNEVVDTITASNYMPLAGGAFTDEVTMDENGIEFQETDTISDCSGFAATGGGIFYDDSDGKLKKCQDNVLTDLDTTGTGAAGNNTEVQYNNGGSLGGIANWETDGTVLQPVNGADLRLKTTTSGHEWSIQVYDNDTGPGWVDALTFTNGNTPSITLGVDLNGLGNYDLDTNFFDAGDGTMKMPTTTSGDQALTVGLLGLKTDEDLVVLHAGANGEVTTEVGISLLEHLVLVMDPAWAYDQESTYRSVPLMIVGDDFPHGFTITEWKVNYVGGDPDTELDADIICDTSPDYNTAAAATVMDVIDTTAGTSTADSGCIFTSELILQMLML
jgi:hypothetical protein